MSLDIQNIVVTDSFAISDDVADGRHGGSSAAKSITDSRDQRSGKKLSEKKEKDKDKEEKKEKLNHKKEDKEKDNHNHRDSHHKEKKDDKDSHREKKEDKDSHKEEKKEKSSKKDKREDKNDLNHMFADLQNFNSSVVDPFATSGDGEEREGSNTAGKSIHIRNQQRNGKKSLTTVQGLNKRFSAKLLVRALKREFKCNGTVILDDEYGEVIQLQGDQRMNVRTFLENYGICTSDQIRVHGA